MHGSEMNNALDTTSWDLRVVRLRFEVKNNPQFYSKNMKG